MKKIVLICAGLIFNFQFSIFNSASAQWFTGMSQKTGLALCIHLTDSVAELYSPMQTADPIPVSSWSLRNDTLHIECKSIGLKVNVVRRDSTFVGYWKQSIIISPFINTTALS